MSVKVTVDVSTKPWAYYLNNCVGEYDEDAEEALWKNVTGKDFYFALDRGQPDFVVITPIEFFDQEGYLYDQHLDIDHILPSYLECLMEGQYERPTSVSAQQIRSDLKSSGFVENIMLLAK